MSSQRTIMEQKSTTFLDLPPKVRRRIYQYAGVTISGMVFSIYPEGMQLAWNHSVPEELRLATRLLQTCKAIRVEVESCLYSNNLIAISEDNIEVGLDVIRRMTPKQCRSLRNLYIQLHVDYRGPSISPERIAAWKATALHVLSHVNPRSLTLNLVCDTRDSKETHDVLEPLFAFSGTLRAFGLRIASTPDTRLISFARKAVARIEARFEIPCNQSFRFLNLPTELRLQILKYTDLVSPYNQVEWDSVQGFRVLDPTRSCYKSTYADDFLQRSISGDQGSDLYDKKRLALRLFCCKIELPYETGDFCKRQCSAYSSICQCWIPPASLFLACRTMYEDAICVLYSCNRVVITPPGGRFDVPLGPKYTPTRLEVARFITRHTYPRVLQHLRHLEIVFPELDPFCCLELSSPFYLDWRFAIDHLKQYGKLHALRITVHISLDSTKCNPWIGPPLRTEWSETLNGRPRPDVRLIAPMQSLREIQGLFIHLDWMWYWNSYPKLFWFDWNLEDRLRQRPRGCYHNTEGWLERIVMGKDYDSFAVGKLKEEPSEWLKRELRLRCIRRDPQAASNLMYEDDDYEFI
ncbi:hypothetical protein F4678DRAFT_443052 [Xylaria arbuscula]|nr:hypothetical protein F4678DRAFT_443052 [Xylaria arbuscula]